MKNKKKLCFGVIIGTRAYFNSVSITNSLNLTGKKLNGTLNTFAEPAGNIGTDVSLFTWTGYNFSSL